MKRQTLALALMTLISVSAVASDKFGGMKDMAKTQANNYAAEKLGLPSTAPSDAKVYFVNLKDGDTVTSPVKVIFGLSGMGVAPAGTQIEKTGHHHLLIDSPTVDFAAAMPATDQIKHFGGGQTETTLTLKPGQHTLQLVFADWKHQAFNPTVASDKITITVK